MSLIQLPNPTYAGTTLAIGVTFTVPTIGLDQADWPVGDPGTVTLKWVGGTGASPVTWTYTGSGGQITRTSTGVYAAVLPTNNPGRWLVEWTGTSPVAAVWAYGWDMAPPLL